MPSRTDHVTFASYQHFLRTEIRWQYLRYSEGKGRLCQVFFQDQHWLCIREELVYVFQKVIDPRPFA